MFSLLLHTTVLSVFALRASAADSFAVFSSIYKQNTWTKDGGGSGTGSTVSYTKRTRSVIAHVLKEHNVQTMIDAPCGSFHWMPLVFERLKAVGAGPNEYTGYDVVASVIQSVSAAHATNVSTPKLQFLVADLTTDSLPRGKDLILSRDALQHLSLAQIRAVLRNFQQADPKLLLVGSYPGTYDNVDIPTGSYFPVNVLRPPFELLPQEVFSEQTPDFKHLLLFTQAQIRAWKLT